MTKLAQSQLPADFRVGASADELARLAVPPPAAVGLTVGAVVPPAGGSTAAFLPLYGHLGVYFGSGPPTVSADQGSLYLRTDGSTVATRLYVNKDGATAWAAVTTTT